ncbi:MAG: protelomerase family protein [Rhizonema sp. PD38]|nr:protelomerase family protein [Rhizonema sp. PD38]
MKPITQETTEDAKAMHPLITEEQSISATEEIQIVDELQVIDEQGVMILTEESTPTVPTFKTETEYHNYETLLKKLASKYYQGFQSGDVTVIGVRQFAQAQLERAQTKQSLMDTRLYATVAHCHQEIVSVAASGSKDGKPNPNTVINLRVDVLNRIKKAVNAEKEEFTITKELEGMEPFTIDYLTQAFESFRGGLVASFSSIAREKRESQGTNFLARRTSTPHACVSDLIEWAIERLRVLPSKAEHWREVALAIMLVTGRRPSEVLSTGVFEAIDQTNLEFYGQLKKKDASQDEKIYRIPALGDTAREVEAASGWLQMMNKRTVPASRNLEDKQEAAKKCHDRFSRYLSEIAAKILAA